MKLKQPIQLTSSIRDWNDLPVAFVATVDGGEVAAFWDNGTSTWVAAPDMTSKVLSAPSMDTETSDRIKKSSKHHKETEYYVVDKVTGKKHRMYLEDEYDLTAPRKKKDNEDN